MAEILKLFFLTTLIFNLSCKAAFLRPNPGVDYKSMTVELDPSTAPKPGVVVVNQLSTTDVPEGFKKYALYDGDKKEYFRAETVTYKSQVVESKPAVKLHNVFNVYTYWKDDLLLAVGFKHQFYDNRALFVYYRRDNGVWTFVNKKDFNAAATGYLPPDNLKNLLKSVVDKAAQTASSSEKDKSSLSTNTKVIVGVVIGFVVVVLLVGLVLFLRK